MILNFTDPFFTTRVLGFEPLFDRLQRLSEASESLCNLSNNGSNPKTRVVKNGSVKLSIIIVLLLATKINAPRRHASMPSGCIYFSR